ncbi:uncharacterized protein LOC111913818 [Lactuca sativa]|uniref:uncharacterized protein LOC111913818 n=1 Tax=Lactuca sativa TaxID=4236 RepID=UPI000CD85632|nr:uncharacterized protein LOC111913818 [Lactuca sativa]
MARFHLPGDPYFPNQENGGWIESEPEEDPKEVFEEEPEEDPKEAEEEEEPEEEEEIDEEELEKELEEEEEEEEPKEELEIINSPYIARVPTNRFGYNKPEPHWETMIERWSHQQ